jgi:L-alanine-DL-glutamate epimerase-like enolase superfamily enzyme
VSVRITKISVYQVDLPVKGGGFHSSGGRVRRSVDTSVIQIDTDEGISGWGEACPFGPDYDTGFAGGARAGIALVAPQLLGKDPRELGAINQQMDKALCGNPYAKTGLDIACWDILGKSTGLPVYSLLGGRLHDEFPFTGFVTLDPGPATSALIDDYRQRGCNRFEFKASGDPVIDIKMIRFVGKQMRSGDTLKVDANGGWKMDEALRVSEAVRDVHVLFEQPCRTYEECRAFKSSTGRPVALDECILEVADLVRAHQDRAIDVLNLKTGRVGGLTRARQMRDLAVTLGIRLYIQDTSGGEFNAAAIVHLAHSTPPGFLLAMWDCAEMVTVQIGRGLVREHPAHVHRVNANTRPGLGVEPLMDVLGEPVAVYG